MTEDEIRIKIKEEAEKYLGRSFWNGLPHNNFNAFTCVHLGFAVYHSLGLLEKKPNVIDEYLKAMVRLGLNSKQPFSVGVDEYFSKRKDKDKIKPGDFIMVYYEEMRKIHFAIYIGNDKYIDTDPDRGYVDYTTLEELLGKDRVEGYLVYDALSNNKTLEARNSK